MFLDAVEVFSDRDLWTPDRRRHLSLLLRQQDLCVVLPSSGERLLSRVKKVALLRFLGYLGPIEGIYSPSSSGFLRDTQFRLGWYSNQVVAAFQAAGGEMPSETGRFRVPTTLHGLEIPPTDAEVVDRLWKDARDSGMHGNPRRLVALSPGAKYAFKCWPLDHYLALASLLVDDPGNLLVVVGGESERPLGEVLADRFPGRVWNYAGKLSVLQTTELLRRCHLFIGNDSGPGHLAAAAGTPVVSLFTASVYPGVWEPWVFPSIALRRSVPCAHCWAETHCPIGTSECIRDIPVQSVYQAYERLVELLDNGGPASFTREILFV
jgi:hypothetical protein